MARRDRRDWRSCSTLAVPALSLRAGSSDAGNDATNLTTRQAYDLIAQGFGAGANGPLSVVVSLPRARDTAAVDRVTAALRAHGRCRVGLPSAAQPDWDHRCPAGLPTLLTAIRGHHRPRQPPAPRRAPGRAAIHRHEDPDRRDERLGDRLQPRAVKQTAALHRGGPDPVGDPARAGVPIAGHPRAGRRDEPAVDRCVARRDRRHLSVGVARQPPRRHPGADRGVHPRDPVRDRLRPLDGLRGVHRLAESTKNGYADATPPPRSTTASAPPDG